jgi:hypothetical protein
MKQFITAAVFSYPHEITILKHLLLEAGITHYFENETIASLYFNAFGGIKLKIHPDDLDAVNIILNKRDTNADLKIV